MTEATVQAKTEVSKNIELEGHIFDSLTLSKVMDTIQDGGGEFRINHLRRGHNKNDSSAASIKVFAPNDDTLNSILEAVSPYGVKVAGDDNASVATCEADGVLPANAVKMYVPKAVYVDNNWLPVESVDGDWVITVTADNKTLLKKAKKVEKGDRVVTGYQGVRW